MTPTPKRSPSCTAVTSIGSSASIRRLDYPEEVVDLVAAAFLELIHAARNFDRRGGRALLWLYGLANKLLIKERWRKARPPGGYDWTYPPEWPKPYNWMGYHCTAAVRARWR